MTGLRVIILPLGWSDAFSYKSRSFFLCGLCGLCVFRKKNLLHWKDFSSKTRRSDRERGDVEKTEEKNVARGVS